MMAQVPGLWMMQLEGLFRNAQGCLVPHSLVC